MIHRVVSQRFGQLVAYAYLGIAQKGMHRTQGAFELRQGGPLQRLYHLCFWCAGYSTFEFV